MIIENAVKLMREVSSPESEPILNQTIFEVKKVMEHCNKKRK